MRRLALACIFTLLSSATLAQAPMALRCSLDQSKSSTSWWSPPEVMLTADSQLNAEIRSSLGTERGYIWTSENHLTYVFENGPLFTQVEVNRFTGKGRYHGTKRNREGRLDGIDSHYNCTQVERRF